MQTSSNYGLKLMEGTDNVKRQDFVDNFTKIDTEMRSIENEAYPIVEATGTNAYVGANVRIKSLGKGTKLTLFVGTNATGNCSLNLNSYGSKNIKDSNGNIVTNIKANIPYNLCYNGTDFILQGKGGGGNLIPKYLLAGYYGEGDNGRVDGSMVNRGAVTQTLSPDGMITLPEGYYNSVKITQSLPVLTGVRMATGVAKWEDGGLAVYPEKGYQKGGSGDGEIKVSVAQIQSVNGWLKPQNILAGCEICGINGTATIQSMGGFPASILLDGSTGSNSNYVLSNNPSELLGRLILFITYSTSGSLLTRGWIYYDSVNTGQRTFRNFTTGGTINYYINTTSSQVTFTPSGDGWSTRRHTIMTVAVDGF